MKCPLLIPHGESALLSHVARRERGAGTARVAEHIRECRACSAFTAAQASVWQTLELWEAPPVSDEFNRKLYARIDQPETWWNRTSQMFSNLVLRPTVPLALATMLLVTGIAVEMPRQTASPVPAPHTAPVVAPVDTEQLDKTFDDLQLLQQLDPKDEASGASDAI